jgi:hypothetical protein
MKNIAMFKYKSGLPLAVIGAFFFGSLPSNSASLN